MAAKNPQVANRTVVGLGWLNGCHPYSKLWYFYKLSNGTNLITINYFEKYRIASLMSVSLFAFLL